MVVRDGDELGLNVNVLGVDGRADRIAQDEDVLAGVLALGGGGYTGSNVDGGNQG